MKLLKTVLMLITFWFGSGLLYAGQPFNTDDASTVGKETFQLELEYEIAVPFSIPAYADPADGMEVKLDYGLSDRLDIYALLRHSFIFDYGFSPLELGLKYSLILDRSAVPLLGMVISFAPGSSEYGIRTAFSREWGILQLNLNLGFTEDGIPATAAVIDLVLASWSLPWNGSPWAWI